MRLRHKFSIWICDSLKENPILHPLLFLFYSEDELFIRKIFISWKLNSSRQINFSFFSVSSAVQTPTIHLNLWQFQREFNSASPAFLLIPSARIFHKKNFHFVKAKFVSINSIVFIFQYLVRFRHKFSIWITDSLKENSIVHLLLCFFY